MAQSISCNDMTIKHFHSTAPQGEIPSSGEALLGMTRRGALPYIGKVFWRSQAATSEGRRGERVR